MAAPTLRRLAWMGAAAVAAAAVFTLALHGSRPESGLARFEAAGVMVHIKPERVREVEVAAGDRRWRFARAATGGWTAIGSPLPSQDWASLIDTGLHFLSVSSPQRVMTREEVAGASPSEFGLAPPRYAVWVRASDAQLFVVEFGSSNAQGIGQYARVAGRPELFLLPRFVGEQWEKATGLQ
ncbi:MAG: hypothetical protein DMD91_28170 [Candidatus Rokuibacteriota bacterium]|nr:MAG: hypothetical protein DMD91_28170 [Candidatus Rokubacteria bacterium]